MDAKFFARGLWSNLYALNGIVFLLIGGLDLFSESAWWRHVLSVLLAAYGVWWLHVARRARRVPMIVVGDSAIDVRPALMGKPTRVLRADVQDVTWFNPGSLGLRLKNGETHIINLIGLSPSDKSAVHDALKGRHSGA